MEAQQMEAPEVESTEYLPVHDDTLWSYISIRRRDILIWGAVGAVTLYMVGQRFPVIHYLRIVAIVWALVAYWFTRPSRKHKKRVNNLESLVERWLNRSERKRGLKPGLSVARIILEDEQGRKRQQRANPVRVNTLRTDDPEEPDFMEFEYRVLGRHSALIFLDSWGEMSPDAVNSADMRNLHMQFAGIIRMISETRPEIVGQRVSFFYYKVPYDYTYPREWADRTVRPYTEEEVAQELVGNRYENLDLAASGVAIKIGFMVTEERPKEWVKYDPDKLPTAWPRQSALFSLTERIIEALESHGAVGVRRANFEEALLHAHAHIDPTRLNELYEHRAIDRSVRNADPDELDEETLAALPMPLEVMKRQPPLMSQVGVFPDQRQIYGRENYLRARGRSYTRTLHSYAFQEQLVVAGYMANVFANMPSDIIGGFTLKAVSFSPHVERKQEQRRRTEDAGENIKQSESGVIASAAQQQEQDAHRTAEAEQHIGGGLPFRITLIPWVSGSNTDELDFATRRMVDYLRPSIINAEVVDNETVQFGAALEHMGIPVDENKDLPWMTIK